VNQTLVTTIAAIAILFWPLAVEAKSKIDEQLLLTVGQQQIISQTSRKIDRIAVGDAAIVSVRSIKKGHEILVTAKAPGTTSLIIWYGRGKKKFQLHVLDKTNELAVPTLAKLLETIEGVSMRRIGGKIILEGNLLRPMDHLWIQRFANEYPGVNDQTKLDSTAAEISIAHLHRQLNIRGYPFVRASISDKTLFLEGSVPTAVDIAKVESFAKTVFPNIDSKLSSAFGNGEMILMDVKMVEVSKSAITNFGIRWQASTTGELTASAGTHSAASAALGLADSVPITLNTLQDKGFARLLSNPKLTCRFEVNCTFKNGGEIPIRLIAERSASITFKAYGIRLDMTPRRADHERIIVEIDAEFSDLDQAAGFDGVPALVKNSVKTSAALRFNQSVILSGLIARRQSKTVSKIPLLGSIPLIGELFKSRNLSSNDSEVLVFLTPLPIIAGDATINQSIADQQQIYDRYKFNVNARLGD
jgi:pilus assembly protein CpaC